MVSIEQIQLPVSGIDQMEAEARSEGYRFLGTLVSEWVTGENRFDGPGEQLCGHLEEGILVAIGGLNRDPFLNDPAVGRIRRVYVRQRWRNRGIGSAVLDHLLSVACRHFHSVRLRAENPNAALLYERQGFVPISNATATHILQFR